LANEVTALDSAVGVLRKKEAGPVQGAVKIFTWGSNDKGTLGQGMMRPPNREPVREIRLPDDAELASAVAGDATCGYVTKAGQLIISGSNQHCVHADRVARGRELPTLVAPLSDRKVSRAFMNGESIHIMAFVDGRLHSWGLNPKALGLDTKAQTVEPTPVERLGTKTYDGGVPADDILSVSLGRGHTLIVMQSGEVFACGSNSRGQLGIGAPRNPFESNIFEAPEGLEGFSFAAASCGPLHSALLSADGKVYTFGQNEYGQLGLASPADNYRATEVTAGSIAGKRVTQLVCGAATTLCLTDDGQLHGCGSNRKGELALGETESAPEFVPLPIPDVPKVAQVTAGADHVLALAAEGRVFAWGENSYGQVTPGQKSRPVKQAQEVESFAGKKVVSIAAGKAHNIVLVAG